MEREACLEGILHISQKPQLSGSPVKEPSLKVPLMESFAERCPTTRALRSSIKVPGFIHLSKSLVYEPPRIPGSPRLERGRHGDARFQRHTNALLMVPR